MRLALGREAKFRTWCLRQFRFSIRTSSKKQPVIDSSKALPPQATFRGPYINTGSQDIGPDHQTYTKK
ncbi:hypothetical protein V2J09_019257 [Rumex salicifolius]